MLPHFCFFTNPTMFGENVLHGPSIPNHQQGLMSCANRREVTETPEDPGWSPGEPCHLTPWAGGGGVQGSGVNPGCRRACWRAQAAKESHCLMTPPWEVSLSSSPVFTSHDTFCHVLIYSDAYTKPSTHRATAPEGKRVTCYF